MKTKKIVYYSAEIALTQRIGFVKGVKNMQFDRCLGPYPMENYQAWQEVSNHISPSIISKLEVHQIAELPNDLQPVGNRIYTTSQEYEEKVSIRKEKEDLSKQLYGFAGLRGEERKEMEVEQPTQPTPAPPTEPEEPQKAKKNGMADFAPMGGTIYFTEIPKAVWTSATTAAEITAKNMDKTLILKDLLLSDYQGGTPISLMRQ